MIASHGEFPDVLKISPSARISHLADIENSSQGTVIAIADGVAIDSFVKIKPAESAGDVEIGAHATISSGIVTIPATPCASVASDEDRLHGRQHARRANSGRQRKVKRPRDWGRVHGRTP